jgi:hypothetical protein
VALRPTHRPMARRSAPSSWGLRWRSSSRAQISVGGAAELVEGEQAQGVAEQHGDAEARVGAVLPADPAQGEGEGDDAEVGLGLAAAGREEDQLDVSRLGSRGIGDPGEVLQEEGELEEVPGGGGVGAEALTRGHGHGLVGERKCAA